MTRMFFKYSLIVLLYLLNFEQGLSQTIVDAGVCTGCESYVTATFNDCDSCVDITSCKDLSNVVLLLCDSTEFKYDNLSGLSGTFCSPNGQDIIGVWVKSGCFLSGDGPGYGYYLDGPCSDTSLADTLPNVTVTAGVCIGCESEVTATFNGCDSCVNVTSCKDLSNVVLLLCDSTEFKFDGLSGNSGTFCSPDGQNITGVWIKAGCFQSGDGPGYGYYLEGPCTDEYCDLEESVCSDGNENSLVGTVSISMESQYDPLASFQLFNLRGQLVHSEKILVGHNGEFLIPTMNGNGLSSGLYIYNIVTHRTRYDGKLFIQ